MRHRSRLLVSSLVLVVSVGSISGSASARRDEPRPLPIRVADDVEPWLDTTDEAVSLGAARPTRTDPEPVVETMETKSMRPRTVRTRSMRARTVQARTVRARTVQRETTASPATTI
ncbi:MAG: hypothetical protein M3Q72_10275, partial [Actinomycetota bacterium]|nr:hypothetical protein [Actinomycetota bacterium]